MLTAASIINTPAPRNRSASGQARESFRNQPKIIKKWDEHPHAIIRKTEEVGPMVENV